MDYTIREYHRDDLPQMTRLWNDIVRDGTVFPQDRGLEPDRAAAFFSDQSFTAVAQAGSCILGLYILHPNNVGHCGHIANASYAVCPSARGMGVGESLVRHSLEKGRELGFTILQFNAVVSTNTAALRLYEKLGFTRLGEIPGGFALSDGRYADITLFYHPL